MTGYLPSTRRRITAVAVAATCGLLVACASSSGTTSSGSGDQTSATASTPSGSSTSSAAATPSESSVPLSDTYPNSLVVLGHSGTTGYNSDPTKPDTDATANSWATGDNPAVNSVYLRLLALNPAVRGHSTNVGLDGSTVDDLDGEIDRALAVSPLPDLFLIQTVDNDIGCNGTDKDNYAPFRSTLVAAMRTISAGAPKAAILVVSSPWATVANYTEVISHIPALKSDYSGQGLCDPFDVSGHPQPAGQHAQAVIIRRYLQEVSSACKAVPACRYDGGALHRMKITAKDITPDGNHLSVAGQAKQAALEWDVLALDG